MATSSDNALTINAGTSGAVVPTRTMASDSKRAQSIEAEREAAIQSAINEIKSLEAALEQAGSNKSADKQSSQPQQTEPLNNAANKDSSAGQSVDPVDTDTGPSSESDFNSPTAAAATPASKQSDVTVTNSHDDDNAADDEGQQTELVSKAPQASVVEIEKVVEKSESSKNEPKAADYGDIIFVEEPNIKPQIPAEDTRIKSLRDEIDEIEKSKLEFIQKRSQFTKREQPIRGQIEVIEHKLESAKTELVPFADQTRSIEEKIAATESRERAATDPKERHEAEKARWQLEDARHQIEEQKWTVSRKVEKIAQDLETKQAELEQVLAEAKSTDTNIAQADQRIKELDIRIKLVKLGDRKKELESKWVEVNDKKRQAEEDLENTRAREAVIEEQVDQLQQNSIETDDPAVRREYEQERRRISLERRELEKNRWSLEQALRDYQQIIENLKPQYQQALDDEADMNAELEKLQILHQQPAAAAR